MARKVAEEKGALAVRGLTKPGLHFVGGVPGLALQITKSGARSWVLRATVGSRRRDIGLGGYPGVTLARAREKADAEREKIRAGVDPVEARRAAKAALISDQASAVTFEQAAARFISAHEAGWRNAKHAAQWRSTLKQYAFPVCGPLHVRDVTQAHVLAILEPIWKTKTETAVRLRGRIEKVLDWATTSKLRQGENPARWRGHLNVLLAKPSKIHKVEHHTALAAADAPAFLARLKKAEGIAALALRFLVLTAARSGEVRGAKWAEINLRSKVWTVPAERMKAGRAHRVPLSTPALAVLKAAPRIEGSDFVFPSARGGALSDMALTAVMRRLEVNAVPHGFRSTFRDWCRDKTTYPREVAEAALAHVIADKTEAAYARSDVFEKRRALMADWARFCDTTRRS